MGQVVKFKPELFRNRRILVTGDTGFKGAWLTMWLKSLGAEVYGYALPAKTPHDLFVRAGLQNEIDHTDADISDLDKLRSIFAKSQPEIVFHLAAQALVQESYINPVENFQTNLMGSVNLLEVVRENSEHVRSLVFVTSDKCYDNKEWNFGYRENDRLGGKDPYSASKGAAELIYASYAHSFLNDIGNLGHASARAGNVIGGGDWSDNRIIPDCIRALQKNKAITIRNPHSTRPWQHVLEPLSGYMILAQALFEDPYFYRGAWNFGPNSRSNRNVAELAEQVIKIWGQGEIAYQQNEAMRHEATLLMLNCDKANLQLGWYPNWDFITSTERTVTWYKEVLSGQDPYGVTLKQIQEYQELLI